MEPGWWWRAQRREWRTDEAGSALVQLTWSLSETDEPAWGSSPGTPAKGCSCESARIRPGDTVSWNLVPGACAPSVVDQPSVLLAESQGQERNFPSEGVRPPERHQLSGTCMSAWRSSPQLPVGVYGQLLDIQVPLGQSDSPHSSQARSHWLEDANICTLTRPSPESCHQSWAAVSSTLRHILLPLGHDQ